MRPKQPEAATTTRATNTTYNATAGRIDRQLHVHNALHRQRQNKTPCVGGGAKAIRSWHNKRRAQFGHRTSVAVSAALHEQIRLGSFTTSARPAHPCQRLYGAASAFMKLESKACSGTAFGIRFRLIRVPYHLMSLCHRGEEGEPENIHSSREKKHE